MRSLRQRAIVGGGIWAIFSVGIGGVALFLFFASLTERRFDEALMAQHLRIVVALGNSGADPEIMESYLTDPAYARPYSGRYWQVDGDDSALLVSRSLFDIVLPPPAGATSEPFFWNGQGPNGPIRGVRQAILLEDDSAWVVTAADSLAALAAEQQQIRQSLLAAFSLVGLLMIVGAIFQTSAVVRPLRKLQQDVARRWDAEEKLVPGDYPDEVSPLVTDINTLLERNRETIDRARRQAADMAHALKTPSAILRNELDAMAMDGLEVTQAADAMDRIDAQLLRSLARIRAANTAATLHAQTDLGNSVDRMTRLFRTMPETAEKTLAIEVEPDLKVPMDVQDLEEVLGNLMENALAWSKQNVRVRCRRSDHDIQIDIEDDGPGIPEGDRREALRSGGRLDTSAPGTGLGLAIAADLLQSYGGTLNLDQSEDLGGLRVAITLASKRGLGTAGKTSGA